VAANGLRESGGASLVTGQAGDEVASFALKFITRCIAPLAGDPDELACAGKGADDLIQIDPG